MFFVLHLSSANNSTTKCLTIKGVGSPRAIKGQPLKVMGAGRRTLPAVFHRLSFRFRKRPEGSQTFCSCSHDDTGYVRHQVSSGEKAETLAEGRA
jgi:hypothetical protein